MPKTLTICQPEASNGEVDFAWPVWFWVVSEKYPNQMILKHI